MKEYRFYGKRKSYFEPEGLSDIAARINHTFNAENDVLARAHVRKLYGGPEGKHVDYYVRDPRLIRVDVPEQASVVSME